MSEKERLLPEPNVMTPDAKTNAARTMQNGGRLEPSYLDLKTLAAYASCSVRWLRDRLVDRAHPLPHYRIGGKILVQRDEFDRWMGTHRVVHPSDQLSQIVDSVLAEVCPPRRVA